MIEQIRKTETSYSWDVHESKYNLTYLLEHNRIILALWRINVKLSFETDVLFSVLA
jgi:hypothetical protein